MLGYFKPWRRKIGVVTLGLACAFAGGWVRCQTHEDHLSLPVDHALYQVRSTKDKIWLCYAYNTHSAKNDHDHYPVDILVISNEVCIANINAPSTIRWQSKTMFRSRSALSEPTLNLEDLNRDPKMKAWNVWGVRRYEKVRSFVDNPTGGLLKTDDVVRILDELVIYVLPYPLIPVALILLSATLLLSKPRSKPANSRYSPTTQGLN